MPSNHLILFCPLLLLPSFFPVSVSVPMSQPFTWGGQSIGASTSASVLPRNIQGWYPWGFTGLSPCCPSNSQESSPAPQFYRISSSVLSLLYGHLSYLYVTTRKTIALTIWTFVNKAMILLFNTLSRLVIAFLPRSKCLNFMATVTNHIDFGAQKNKVSHCFQFPPTIWHEKMGLDAMILVFWMLHFKLAFFTLIFHPHQEAL